MVFSEGEDKLLVFVGLVFVGHKQNHGDNICLLLVLAHHPRLHHHHLLHLLLLLVPQQECSVEGQVPGHCHQRHSGRDKHLRLRLLTLSRSFRMPRTKMTCPTKTRFTGTWEQCLLPSSSSFTLWDKMWTTRPSKPCPTRCTSW